jgi:hypothetical protein
LKKSTKYKILEGLALSLWLWMLFFFLVYMVCESVARVSRVCADWIYSHTPVIPETSLYHKMRQKRVAALWEEYEQSEDADPRVLKGKPTY